MTDHVDRCVGNVTLRCFKYSEFVGLTVMVVNYKDCLNNIVNG
jgi:hypothetical protein